MLIPYDEEDLSSRSKRYFVIIWPTEWKVFKAEVMWQQPSGTSSWSAWLLLQRLFQTGPHLEPRLFLILQTRPPTCFLIVYAVRRYFRLWKLFLFLLLIEQWGNQLSSIAGWHGIWAVGWKQLTLLFCEDMSLVIGRSHSYWLDDGSSPLVYHRY